MLVAARQCDSSSGSGFKCWSPPDSATHQVGLGENVSPRLLGGGFFHRSELWALTVSIIEGAIFYRFSWSAPHESHERTETGLHGRPCFFCMRNKKDCRFVNHMLHKREIEKEPHEEIAILGDT